MALDDNCPHAALFAFVLSAWATCSGMSARGSSYEEDERGGILTLRLASENRWCSHVQRPHRSNGTYLRINRQRRCFRQFCFDAECKAEGFRGSEPLPIPPELCAFVEKGQQQLTEYFARGQASTHQQRAMQTERSTHLHRAARHRVAPPTP